MIVDLGGIQIETEEIKEVRIVINYNIQQSNPYSIPAYFVGNVTPSSTGVLFFFKEDTNYAKIPQDILPDSTYFNSDYRFDTGPYINNTIAKAINCLGNGFFTFLGRLFLYLPIKNLPIAEQIREKILSLMGANFEVRDLRIADEVGERVLFKEG